MDALIQCGNGFDALFLQASHRWHLELCDKYNLTFLSRMDFYSGDALRYITQVLNSDLFNRVCFLAPRTLWIDDGTDLIDALPDHRDIAAVLDKRGRFDDGAIWLRNTPYVRGMLHLALKPLDQLTVDLYGCGLRGALNSALAESQIPVAYLNGRYNAFRDVRNKPDGAVKVRSWKCVHGSCALREMRAIASNTQH